MIDPFGHRCRGVCDSSWNHVSDGLARQARPSSASIAPNSRQRFSSNAKNGATSFLPLVAEGASLCDEDIGIGRNPYKGEPTWHPKSQ